MLNLEGVLPASKIRDINDYTNLRFCEKEAFETPEALSLYEQGYMSKEEVKRLCEAHYGYELYEPVPSYIPEKIVSFFRNSGCVPVLYQPLSKVITVVYLPELSYVKHEYPDHTIVYKPTTIYYYLQRYQMLYGLHKCLQNSIPAKTLFDFVVKEALELGAVDITISNSGEGVAVYYKTLRGKINSHYYFNSDFILDLKELLTIQSPMDELSKEPKRLSYTISSKHRARVLINYKFGGYVITIRLLDNATFNTDISELNLTPKSCEALKKHILNAGKGLRIIAGATANGKNTTALCLLRELAKEDSYKIMSVEMPVEQELSGIEQLDCETVEEYVKNIQSLIWANPDFIYITEIQDETGLATLQVSNTGKCVLSTLHANSVGDVISRLVDITKLDQDRVIQALHTVVYQELIIDDEQQVRPKVRYVRFTDELKYKLYGKSLGEVIKIIREYEEGDIWTFSQLTQL